jgi:hypothetical protein
MFMDQDDESVMAKAKKEEKNSKPPARIGFLRVLVVLAGADLLLICAPWVGIGNSLIPIDERFAWGISLFGILLIVVGLRGIFRKA